ncbi:MAG: PfkB family carbohydrate kinase [Brachybacterium sp.]|uniref:PfkB family carbohydrate kinase n=1 Tax=Brachybacterium sp. TaxID=1891286 RepID=UPI00264772FC|nr:PfkB family carbohydrate kinase [Brachybacterium sp.]MDN5686215.1 PfkB family carbohydrate kinase [Brachybacterium sp.]
MTQESTTPDRKRPEAGSAPEPGAFGADPSLADSRVPLRTREDLSIYWDNHLRVAFEQSAPHDLPAMVEASLAHVIMLRGTGALEAARADRLLGGLVKLWRQWGDQGPGEEWTPRVSSHPFDGSVEDPYYYLEQQLAAACGMSTADLDVQLARSRNDLDAGVFRMILRRGILDLAELLLQNVRDLVAAADRTVESVLIGHTHRRPAQPTTIAHVLSGLAEALLSQADELLSVYDEMNVSPLGSAAFTGTDVAIDAERVAELLGFSQSFTASYEAVAGAEHFMRLASLHARISATGARWARVLQEWMNLGWVRMPDEFTQGSSIMPQKKNPVVLEHLVSMAGAATGETNSILTTIAAGWYEDSNNATTDVQKHLWSSTDRVIRFARLLDGLTLEIEPAALPSDEDIVRSGATTTAVAEALATRSVPWRGAHDVVGTLFRQGDPTTWTAQQVDAALAEAGIADDGPLRDLVLTSGRDPRRILGREQPGSPGRAPIATALTRASKRTEALAARFRERRDGLETAREELLTTAAEFAGNAGTRYALSVIGNANLDVIVHSAHSFPPAGTEQIVPTIEVRLGGSAAIAAQRAAQLGAATRLSAKVGADPTGDLVRTLATVDGLDIDLIREPGADSGLTVVAEDQGSERSFLSSLGAMGRFGPSDVPAAAFEARFVLCSGYFLLPGMQGAATAALLTEAHRQGARTAVDTGHPDSGWTPRSRAELLEEVLPHTDIFLPNESELTGLAGLDDVEDAARDVAARTGAMVIAKLGAAGALLCEGDSLTRAQAPKVVPVDTTGAGDSFNAALLGALSQGRTAPEALEFAVSTASMLVATAPEEREGVLSRVAL